MDIQSNLDKRQVLRDLLGWSIDYEQMEALPLYNQAISSMLDDKNTRIEYEELCKKLMTVCNGYSTGSILLSLSYMLYELSNSISEHQRPLALLQVIKMAAPKK